MGKAKINQLRIGLRAARSRMRHHFHRQAYINRQRRNSQETNDERLQYKLHSQ
jgi:hypothetical protein